MVHVCRCLSNPLQSGEDFLILAPLFPLPLFFSPSLPLSISPLRPPPQSASSRSLSLSLALPPTCAALRVDWTMAEGLRAPTEPDSPEASVPAIVTSLAIPPSADASPGLNHSRDDHSPGSAKPGFLRTSQSFPIGRCAAQAIPRPAHPLFADVATNPLQARYPRISRPPPVGIPRMLAGIRVRSTAAIPPRRPPYTRPAPTPAPSTPCLKYDLALSPLPLV